jgi:HEAT repeat protein
VNFIFVFTVCFLARPSQLYGRDDAALTERVKELIKVLGDPEARGANLNQTNKAIDELVKIGTPAVPHLVKTVLEEDPRDNGTNFQNKSRYSALTLEKMGKPALEHVTQKWNDLNDTDRWKLMRYRGEHDYDAALPYALESLNHKSDDVVIRAVRYFGKYKERKAIPLLVQKLNTATARIRWDIIESLTAIGGDGVDDGLINLLDKDGWAAKGEGLDAGDGGYPAWWPDGRGRVVEALHELKSKKGIKPVLQVLREKGHGQAYLYDFILPYLAECGDASCLPDVKRIIEATENDRNNSAAIIIKAYALEAQKKITERTK